MESPVTYVNASFNTIAFNFKKDSEIGSCFASWMRMNKFQLSQMETGESGTQKNCHIMSMWNNVKQIFWLLFKMLTGTMR